MGQNERREIIQKIQEMRGSKIISYITSDRGGPLPPLKISDDAINPLFHQLESLEDYEKIDLFLYTRGGSTNSAFRIANLFTSYCENFNILIPHRCHSAGTLIATAANEIVTIKLGELSPVDPSITSPYAPEDKAGRPKPISVEDVFGYLDLSENKAGLISEDSKLETFRLLSDKSHPLALGRVHRAYNEIRYLLKELLSRHMDKIQEKSKIDEIIHELTEVYSHFYMINKKRASEIGLKILDDVNPELEKLMIELIEDYKNELKMNEPFDSDVIYGSSEAPINVQMKQGIIESEKSTNIYVRTAIIAKGVAQPIQVSFPGMPRPTTIIPHTDVVPTIVKFNLGKWEDTCTGNNFV